MVVESRRKSEVHGMGVRRALTWAVVFGVSMASCARSGGEKSAGNAADGSSPVDIGQNWTVSRGLALFLVHGERLTGRGGIDGVGGELRIDLSDLHRTRGALWLDLASLRMTSFDDRASNERETAKTLASLHVATPGLGERERRAVFTLREVTRAQPNALDLPAAPPSRARIAARGDGSFGGRTATGEVELEASVSFEGRVPRSLHLSTVRDIVVDLEEIGYPADLALELEAVPKP
jgi:hypothetical protein